MGLQLWVALSSSASSQVTLIKSSFLSNRKLVNSNFYTRLYNSRSINPTYFAWQQF